MASKLTFHKIISLQSNHLNSVKQHSEFKKWTETRSASHRCIHQTSGMWNTVRKNSKELLFGRDIRMYVFLINACVHIRSRDFYFHFPNLHLQTDNYSQIILKLVLAVVDSMNGIKLYLTVMFVQIVFYTPDWCLIWKLKLGSCSCIMTNYRR